MTSRLLVFARAPIPGQAKTRLAPVLGPAGAAALHAALVEDTLARAIAAAIGPVELWAADGDPDGFLAGLAAKHGLDLRRQQGADLGARMMHALQQATAAGDTSAMVIGTDCPSLEPVSIREAAGLLATHDAVLGPADDGGYVLLGLHRVAPELFAGMDWGTDRVLPETRRRLVALEWDWAELAPHADVDRPGDLAAVAALGGRWARLCRPGEGTT